MTATEMYNEFKAGYDEALSFSAPALDHYDISVFLTRAQEELLKRRIHAQGNKYGEAFDTTEKRKRDFDELLRTVTINLKSTSQVGAVPNSAFYDLPEGHMFTVMERADIKLNYTDPCHPTGIIQNVKIKPITYDTYLSNKDNPFKKPDRDNIWRLVHSRNSIASNISANNKKRHQLVTDGTYSVYNYYLTYLSKPKPIITGTLSGTLSVDGYTAQQNCELDPEIHREIVTEAVRIASATLRDQGFQMDMANTQLSE